MRTKHHKTKYTSVKADPVKSFFVEMLTRDIPLEYSILDLLDNCIDGIIRTNDNLDEHQPYSGYRANIEFDNKVFKIEDNCGGIPWELHKYAFRMGRLDSKRDIGRATVGNYGIGMKRALFKMGKHCIIKTQNNDDGYEIEITPKWLGDEKNWSLPVKGLENPMPHDGTSIVINKLHPSISSCFGPDKERFGSDLTKMLATHYAFIIDKGFEVVVNGRKVIPKPTKLVFAELEDKVIKPFIYRAEDEGVKVFLTVGLTRAIPSQEDVIDEQKEKQYSSQDAGWTVVCNDRAVLYCDRTELTGWGEAGVPRYHTQFIAISGIVEFRSEDPSKLPTTTTKREVDYSSALYLKVKNKMREGMQLFTNYTNKWKGMEKESKEHIKNAETLSLIEIKNKSDDLKLNTVTKYLTGEQYKPALPIPPPKEEKRKKISYSRSTDEVEIVAEYLFSDRTVDPKKVGEKCFEEFLKEAQE